MGYYIGQYPRLTKGDGLILISIIFNKLEISKFSVEA